VLLGRGGVGQAILLGLSLVGANTIIAVDLPNESSIGSSHCLNLPGCLDVMFSKILSLLQPQRDLSLTLTWMQHPAIVGNTGNRKPFTYAVFSALCNTQQRLTTHS
jgi:hypothetical protein